VDAETILRRRIDRLKGILKSCTLCPRKCLVDRTRGESGFCLLTDDVVVSHALPHYGEEPPISGTRGAGTIFLSSCNLKCIYCQNYQLSHDISGVKDYAAHAIPSIKEMVRQVGGELLMGEGVAKRGMLIRHLIIPGFISNSLEVLGLIKKHISLSVPLSIMSQYTPMPSVKNHPHLRKRITRDEYELVINHALDMGFETIFTQDVDDRALVPDFRKKAPFDWS